MSSHRHPLVSREEITANIRERRRRVVAMTKCGMTLSQIATALRVTIRTVERDRTATGCHVAEPKIPLSADELRHAQALLDDGCSYKEAARTIGRSPNALSTHFPGRGWPRQQSGQYGRLIRDFNSLESIA